MNLSRNQLDAGTNPQVVSALNPAVPIVFSLASDPVQAGIVASLSRPTGNMTGVTNLGVEVRPKLIELLHELVPQVKSIALIVIGKENYFLSAEGLLMPAKKDQPAPDLRYFKQSQR